MITVYDNGGKTWDRYTVIINDDVFTMSNNPTEPNGFNQYWGLKSEMNPKTVLKRQMVMVETLPDEVQRAINARLKGGE